MKLEDILTKVRKFEITEAQQIEAIKALMYEVVDECNTSEGWSLPTFIRKIEEL